MKILNTVLACCMLITSNHFTHAQSLGCTDKNANNFNPNAIANDGSCTYNNASIAFINSILIDPTLQETSGLIYWNNQYWTHNDDSDNKIYAIDSLSGNIVESIAINGLQITDWEDLQQDSLYIYIGDVGNNVAGNRDNLRILRISKNSINTNSPSVDTISFVYSWQTTLNPIAANTSDFDCEAFIVSNDSIYLFTKEWTSLRSTIYVIPNEPGAHSAQRKIILDVNGLITGASYIPQKNAIALCGYSKFLQPFIYFITDLHHFNFKKANKQKIVFSSVLGYQIEAIASANGQIFYLTNERFSMNNVTVEQQMHSVDLSEFYPKKNNIHASEYQNLPISVFPNPTKDTLHLKNITKGNYILVNSEGKTVKTIIVENSEVSLSVAEIPSGIYFLQKSDNTIATKIIVE